MATTLEKELRELVLALALFLGGLGYAVSGLPANIVVGCAIWGFAWILVAHLFFVSEYTESCPTDVKVVFWGAVTFLVVLALLRPVQTQYAKEHAPASPTPQPERREPTPESPPLLPPPRSYIVFDGYPYFGEYKDDKGLPLVDQNFQVGYQFAFNYRFKQTGPNPVDLTEESKWLYVEPDFEHNTQRSLIADFKRRMRMPSEREPDSGNREPATFTQGRDAFNTAFAAIDHHVRIVTKDDLNALHAGTEIAFVIVQLTYKDNKKVHHARLCSWLQPPARYPGIWHDCIGFNHSD